MKFFVPFFLFLSLFTYSCKRAGEMHTSAAEKTTAYAEEVVLKEIARLGDLVYDAPDSCLLHPDSFLLPLKQLPESVDGKVMYAYLLLNMAYLLRDQGRVLPAIRFYEKALDYYSAHNLVAIDFLDYIAKPLGSLYTITGDFEKATALQYLAISTAEREGRTDVLPALYGNLAITLLQTNLYDSVLAVCRRGLAYTQGQNLVSARLYNEMANCFLKQQQIDSARIFNAKALVLFDQQSCSGDTTIWFAAALMLQSDLARLNGFFPEALSKINRAIDLTEATYPEGKKREKAKFYQQRAELLLQAGQIVPAQKDFKKVLELFLPQKPGLLFADNTVTDALWGLARANNEMHLLDTAIFYYTRAIENDYVVQRSIVSRESNYWNSRHNRVVLREVMDLLWQEYTRSDSQRKQELALLMLWNTELSKGRQLLLEVERSNRWQKDTLASKQRSAKQKMRYLFDAIAEETDTQQLKYLKAEVQRIAFEFQLSEQYFAQQNEWPQWDDFKERIQQISRNSDLLSWQINEGGNSYGICVFGNQARAFQLTDSLFRSIAIQKLLETYFQRGPDAYNDDPGQFQKSSAYLLDVLIPDRTYLRNKDWIVSPDGTLFALPLDALYTKDHFLVQEKNITYTYTLLQNVRQQTQAPKHADIHVFYRSKHQWGLPDLHYVAAESQAISDDYVSEVFEGEAASDQAFMESMHTPSILHLATHAVVDNHSDPFIALTNKLTLDEIQYTAANAPLVILSACQTASGKWLTAEGRESLNRAFLSKGVKGVVASQWPVNDEVMPQMVTLFYSELYQTHKPEVALANAKRAFLQQSQSPQMRNPWYWASLSYTGVQTEIIISKKKRYGQLLLPLLATSTIVLVGGVLYSRMKPKKKIRV